MCHMKECKVDPNIEQIGIIGRRRDLKIAKRWRDDLIKIKGPTRNLKAKEREI